MVRTFLTLMKNIEETCESAADICKLQLKALHRAYTLDLRANSDIIQLSLDYKVAIDSSYNPEDHARTKHDVTAPFENSSKRNALCHNFRLQAYHYVLLCLGIR